jgi:hypothetical protein
MSAFNDPRYLAASGAIKGVTMLVEQDRACPACGYNLKGLAVGGVCPECGRAIALAAKKGDTDMLVDAPRGYLNRFAGSLTIAFVGLSFNLIGLFTVVVLAIVNSVFGFYGQTGPNGMVGPQLRIPTPSDGVFATVFLAGAGVWLTGLIIATIPRPTPLTADASRATEWKRLRIATVITQSGWFLASALILVIAIAAPTPPPGTPMPGWVPFSATVAVIAACGGLVGLIPTAILLARYADWIPDPELGWRMRTSAWSIGVFGTLILLTGVTPPGLPSVAGLIPFVLWMTIGFIWIFFLAGLGVLFVSIAQMAKTSWDAVANHRHREEKDQRMLEKMRREREEQDRRAELMGRHDEPSPGVRKIGVAPKPPHAGS